MRAGDQKQEILLEWPKLSWTEIYDEDFYNCFGYLAVANSMETYKIINSRY